MRGCIAFSFWGDRDSSYFRGIESNAIAANQHYENWDVLIFAERGKINDEERQRYSLINKNLAVIDVDLLPGWSGMFWRMLPVFMNSYTHLCVRDLDSIITLREAIAVRDWLEEGTDLHIMRDHPAHTALIMGGMFGIRCNKKAREVFRPVKRMILEMHAIEDRSYWQIDQEFLASKVYPAYETFHTVHDPYYERKAFSCPREERHRYIGRPDMKLGLDVCEEDSSLLYVDEYLNQHFHSHLQRQSQM